MIKTLIAILSGCVAAGACAMPGPGSAEVRWVEPGTGMVFVRINAGRFVMGSPADEVDRETQETQHEVTLSQPFWLGAFEVTQHQWLVVMGNSPSWFRGADDRLPVESVNSLEVHTFLERLTARSPGSRFRLPTEAEWEYACRAGSTAPYSTGSTIDNSQANMAKSPELAAAGQTMPVGSFAPNAWGLYDMHGNVWEWTEDEHCPYPDNRVIDPAPRCGSPLKVIRGGSWHFGPDSARCALRYTHRPQDRGFSLGFRVVREEVNGKRE